MLCPNCGAPNRDDAAFCLTCRKSLERGSVAAQPAPATSAPQQPWQAPYYDRPTDGRPMFVYAAFWPRFGAWLLDFLFATLVAAIPAVVLAIVLLLTVSSTQDEPRTRFQEDEQNQELGWAIVGGAFVGFIPAYLAYHTISNAKGGGWGKRIVGLRVLRERDGALPGYGTGFLRTIAPSLIGFAPLVGSILQLLDYLWCIWDKQKQTLHDKISGTVVVAIN